MPSPSFLFNIMFEMLLRSIRHGTEMKGIVFPRDLKTVRDLLELINTFSNVRV